MPEIRVTATMSRNYGPVTMSFSLERMVEAKNAADILAANDSMIKALNMQFEDYETVYLPKLPVPQSKGLPEATKPEGKQWYVAKEAYMSVVGGKTYFYIIPNVPKWAKYGAAVYFDRFTGLTETEMRDLLDPKTFKHTFPDGMRVLIEEFKGKPRALQIAHKDTIGEG